MLKKLENLLQAINLADYDGLKTVDVEMEDLKLLRAVILDQQEALKKQTKELYILQAKATLKDMDRPIKLNSFKTYA